MQTVDRNGKFIISAPFKPQSDPNSPFGEAVDVKFTALEGKEITVFDLTSAIADDCFGLDGSGMDLNSMTLNCHIIVGEREYRFSISENNSFEDYLLEIATQMKL